MLCLQKHFWDTAKLMCPAGGNYGERFSTKKGVTQGGPLSSLMINVCVDAVVRGGGFVRRWTKTLRETELAAE